MASKDPNSINWLGRKYSITDEGHVVDELNNKIGGGMADTIKEQIAIQQADAQESKATKKQEAPAQLEQPKSQDNTKTPLPTKEGGALGAFGRAARAVNNKIFATMFPRLSGLLKELDTDISETNRASDKLDNSMQGVSEQLNETNNLLAQLNNQMTKMLGLLGQILSKGGTSSGSSSSGGSMASAFIGGLLGIGAVAAIPYIQKWLSGDNKPNDITPASDITPPIAEPPPPVIPTPQVPEKRSDAERADTNIRLASIQSDDTAQRQMAATREFESGSSEIISTYSNMNSEQQSKAGGLDTILNSYKSNIGKKYGVSSFAMRMSDYTTQEGQLKPSFEAGVDDKKPVNTASAALEELKTTSESSNRDLKIDAEKISFNADGILFKQSGGEDTEQPGSFGSGTTPESGYNSPGGFFPVPKPELATVKSKGGASAQVAVKYKERFQGLVDYLDNTNPGYIKVLGGYNNRPNVNNPSVPSWHAYGAALDINPSENPNGSTKTTLPPGIGMVAKSFGLGWGMNWKSVKDPMHFSAAPNEGGTGDIFVPSSTGGSGTETQSQQTPNFVRPTITQGTNLAAATSISSSTAPSSAPSQTTTPVKSSPPTTPTGPGAPAKLRDSNVVGLVEPPDAHAMYPVWFGPAISPKYNNRHDEVR